MEAARKRRPARLPEETPESVAELGKGTIPLEDLTKKLLKIARARKKRPDAASEAWAELAKGAIPLEELREKLSKIPYSLSDVIIEERNRRRARHS